MQISFQQLRTILKILEPGIKVYRDDAPTTGTYPYIVYEFVNESHKRASNQRLYSLPLYQIAFITKGIESDVDVLKNVLDANGVIYDNFIPGPYDENDSTITQFITYVRCVNG